MARIERIESLDDPRLAVYAHLTEVQLRSRAEPERGIFIAESAKVIERALEDGQQPLSMLMEARWLDSLRPLLEGLDPDLPVFVAEQDVLKQLTGFRLHRGALAAMRRRPLRPLSDVLAGARRVAVLEDIVDHTNVGAIFRSAAALGVDAVLATPSCADPLYRRSVRVSMGTVFQVPWTRIGTDEWGRDPRRSRDAASGTGRPWPDDGLEELRAAGFVTAALALRDDVIGLDELAARAPERLALVLGTEGEGLSPRTIARCDLVVRIPMARGVDSLNVAAASAVAFWATRT